jgi:hypothetical protein
MIDGLAQFARDYSSRGLSVVAINSNDASRYPEDSPANMAQLAAHKGFSFPYLYDASQAVARAYEAVCTPDLYLFDQSRKLVYRGQFDASRPGSKQPVTGADLRAAADALLAGRKIAQQIPSVGCSIKWKAGQEPARACGGAASHRSACRRRAWCRRLAWRAASAGGGILGRPARVHQINTLLADQRQDALGIGFADDEFSHHR